MTTNNAWDADLPIVVSQGGTGLSTITDGGLLLGSGTGAITVTAQPTNGQLLVGSTGVDPVLASLTGGTGITVTPGAGSITIATTAAGGNVVGTAPSTDMALTRWDGANADAIEDSTVKVTDAGEMTNASQPAFLAYLPSTDNNASGDGTVYTIGGTTALTEIYDQNSDFNTNGTFTAPVTGRYYFSAQIFLVNGTDITGATMQLAASNRSLRSFGINGPSTVTNVQGKMDSFVDMDAADTVTVTMATTDTGGKIDDVSGGATNYVTRISGFLAC